MWESLDASFDSLQVDTTVLELCRPSLVSFLPPFTKDRVLLFVWVAKKKVLLIHPPLHFDVEPTYTTTIRNNRNEEQKV